MRQNVNLVDLVMSFPTNIFLQNLASIQKRTSPVKFAHLAEKSGKGSIPNLSTKARGAARVPRAAAEGAREDRALDEHRGVERHDSRRALHPRLRDRTEDGL